MSFANSQQNSRSDNFYPSTLLNREIFCPEQKIRARFKQELSNDIVERLRQSENKIALACAERLERCASPQNVFVAADLHNSDGEAYSANGNLWACSSLLCQNCVGKIARNNRKTIRHVVKNEKLFVGENWYFITPTMPNLLLKGHSLDFITLVFQKAFEVFTHRNNDIKKHTQYQKLIRGMFKNAEFTYTENEVFNFHAHLLAIAKSKIQRDNFSLIRSLWTKALEKAFEFYGLHFELNTSDNLAVVNVQKVNFANREKTIQELCKYVTKSDSWANIPLEEIEKIIDRPRRVRMFEALGACRESAKKMRDDLTKARAEIRSNINDKTYLDTKELIPRNTLKRRESWRERIKHQTLDEYKKHLDIEVLDAQEWRRQHLLRMFPCAKFETLDGRRWCARPLKAYEWTRTPSKGKPNSDDGRNHAPSDNRNASPYRLISAPNTPGKKKSNWELFDSFCDLKEGDGTKAGEFLATTAIITADCSTLSTVSKTSVFGTTIDGLENH
jgi:hypothetical protein